MPSQTEAAIAYQAMTANYRITTPEDPAKAMMAGIISGNYGPDVGYERRMGEKGSMPLIREPIQVLKDSYLTGNDEVIENPSKQEELYQILLMDARLSGVLSYN